MRNHLKVEHDMVRYEVELMLHLCLINKKEHDTIIKTLTFRLDQFVKEGLIENQFNLFHLKTKDEALQQETALADHQTKPDETLNETVYKSFSAEESLVAEKAPVNDPLSKKDEQALDINEKLTQIDPEVESVLNKSFVEVVAPSKPEVEVPSKPEVVVPLKPEVEVIEIEKPTTRKESLGPSEDLSLVIDDDSEDDDDVVVEKAMDNDKEVKEAARKDKEVKEAVGKDKEAKEAASKDKEVKEAVGKDKEAKEVTDKTDNFDLLILTDEPELIVELRENEGKSVEKKERSSPEKKGNNCRGDGGKKFLEVRVDVARIRTRSTSVKENAPQKGSCKRSEKKRKTMDSGGESQQPFGKMTRRESGGFLEEGGESRQPVRKMRRRESGGLEEGGKSYKQPVRKMTRRRIK